jgi:hypothetical protein
MDTTKEQEPHYAEESEQEPHYGEEEDPDETGTGGPPTRMTEETGTESGETTQSGMKPTDSGGSAAPMP